MIMTIGIVIRFKLILKALNSNFNHYSSFDIYYFYVTNIIYIHYTVGLAYVLGE